MEHDRRKRSSQNEFITIGFREIYTKHRRAYTKQSRAANNTSFNSSSGATTPTPSVNLVSSRLQLEKDYKAAIQKQDQKIDLTKKMYDLVSRHIERIDSQMAKSDISDLDWMGQATSNRKGLEDSWKLDAVPSSSTRKRPSPHGALSARKRLELSVLLSIHAKSFFTDIRYNSVEHFILQDLILQ